MELGPIPATLWYLGIALKFLVVIVALRRGRFRVAPLFFAYALTLLLRSGVLWSSTRFDNYSVYFYSYWSGQLLLVGLGLGVVWEIYSDAFRQLPSVHRWTSVTFGAALVGLLLTCI